MYEERDLSEPGNDWRKLQQEEETLVWLPQLPALGDQ